MLAEHTVVTAYEMGWSVLTNGALLDAAERDGCAIFITTDSNLKYQQNLRTRRIGIVVLRDRGPMMRKPLTVVGLVVVLIVSSNEAQQNYSAPDEKLRVALAQ